MIRATAALATIAALGLTACASMPGQGPRPLTAHMTGAAEKPTPGDPDGMGHATFKVDTAANQVCYDIMVEKIGAAGAAHIHQGGPADAGPPVVMLKPPGADGKVSDCATADAAVIADILANPGNYYANVHTGEFRGGAIRGQLSK